MSSDRMEKFIRVRSEFTAFHYWKDAPDSVAFLRNVHRHIFKVEVTLPVGGPREYEFFTVKSDLESVIKPIKNKTFPYSCEELASTIATEMVGLGYDSAGLKVAVSEDGESDGIIIMG